MGKIPVGATIAYAYRFAFGSFVKILGVMWLTWALMMVPAFLIMRQMTAFMSAAAAQDPGALLGAMPLFLALYILIILMLFVQIAGLTRLALGLPMPSPYYYFSLGKPVWRLVGACLLVALIAFVAAIVVGIVIGILGAITAIATGGGVSAASGLVVIAITLIVYGVMIYGMVRLGFLLNPVVIAEERIGLKRAWQLGKGNFWRSFVVVLAIFLPLVVLELAWLYGPWGPGFPMPLAPNATAEQIAAYQASTMQWMDHFVHLFTGYWYLFFPIGLAVGALFYGAMVGAQCFAYRALTQGGAED
jgi:hypothetical protein